MTKFAKIASVLALVLALGACATSPAQDDASMKGDSTFSHAQHK